jgi:hypothetical protein
MAVPSLASPDQFVTIIYAPNAEQATFNITSSSCKSTLENGSVKTVRTDHISPVPPSRTRAATRWAFSETRPRGIGLRERSGTKSTVGVVACALPEGSQLDDSCRTG